jgi:hypothetical protein
VRAHHRGKLSLLNFPRSAHGDPGRGVVEFSLLLAATRRAPGEETKRAGLLLPQSCPGEREADGVTSAVRIPSRLATRAA